MATDKVTAGQHFYSNPLAFDAATINSSLDMLAKFKRQQLGGPGDFHQEARCTTDQIKIRNLSGENRRLGEVLELGAELLDEVKWRTLWFGGITPVSTPVRKFGILRDPTAAGEIRKASVSGACVAWVQVGDVADTHAEAREGSYILHTVPGTGPIELLSTPVDGYHEQLMIVRFSAVGSDVVMFRLEEELQRGMAADARVMDPVELVTRPGEMIAVMDDVKKHYARGTPAPAGDEGGDAPGTSSIGWAIKTGAEDDDGKPVYSVLVCGSWYSWIEGTLQSDSWTTQTGLVTGWGGEWPRGDDGTASGNLSLVPVCGLDPVEGMYFKAVFDEISRSYKITTLCCVP